MRRTARNAVREKTHGTQPSGRASLHRTSRLPIPVSRAHTPAEMQTGTAERAGTVARAGRGGGGLAESGWPRGRRSESGEPGWNMYALCRHGRGPVPLPLPPDRFFFSKKNYRNSLGTPTWLPYLAPASPMFEVRRRRVYAGDDDGDVLTCEKTASAGGTVAADRSTHSRASGAAAAASSAQPVRLAVPPGLHCGG